MITSRISTGTGTLLRNTFYVDGVATDATGAVSVTILREDGTTLTTGTATSAGSGVYTFALSQQTACDVLTVTWTGTVSGITTALKTRVEVVGGRYATIADVRSLDGLSDTNLFTTAIIEDSIRWAEDVIDRYIGTPFTRRYARERLDGDGTSTLRLSHQRPLSLQAVTENGTASTTTNWTLYDAGFIVKDTGTFASPSGNYAGGRNVTVKYEYGYEYPPEDIAWAARTLARYYCVELFNRIPDRATGVTNEFGNITLAMAGGPGRPTSLPEVNAILNRYRGWTPVVG